MSDTRLEQIRQRLKWDKHPQEISRTDVEYLVERLEAAEADRDRLKVLEWNESQAIARLQAHILAWEKGSP